MKMKTQAVVGFLAAGMMAVTGFAGVQSILGGTIAVVEKAMEVNEGSGLSESGDAGEIGTVTKYKSFDEIVDSLDKGWGYAYVKIAGYPEKALAVAPSDDAFEDRSGIVYRDGKAVAGYVTIYTKSANGKIVCAGSLKTGVSKNYFNMDKNGVIYVLPGNNYETYFLSADGTELLHKDFIQVDKSTMETAWGYTRATNKDKTVERDFTLAEFQEYCKKAPHEEGYVKFTVK